MLKIMLILLSINLVYGDCTTEYLEPSIKYYNKSSIKGISKEESEMYLNISIKYNEFYKKCIKDNNFKPYRDNAQSTKFKDLY